MIHTISILVQNHPGVLAHLSDLFVRRGYNIEKIKAGKYKKTNLTQINIAATGSEDSFDSLIDQLGALSQVVKVDVAKQRRYSFWLVAFCLCMTLLGTNLPAPLYSLYQEKWNFTSGTMTFIYALYALIVIPTIITVAQLSEQWGRKKVLFAGVTLSIFGSIGFAVSDGVNGLILARIFQGLSVGILNGIAVSYMTELHPYQDKVKSAFVAAIAGTLGNALGPLISGFLGEYAPYPLQFSYLIHILLAATGMLGLKFMLEKNVPTNRAASLRLPSVTKEFRWPFLMASSTSFLSWGIMSLMLSVMPTYLGLFTSHASLSLSGTMVALVLGVSTLHQIMLRKQSAFRSIIIGYILLIIGLIFLVVTLFTKSLFFLILTTVLIGLGNGPSYAGSLAYLNQISTNEMRTNLTSLFFVVTYLGISIPMVTLGYIGQWIGLTHAIQWYSYIMIGFIILSLIKWLRGKVRS
ncbi:MFS transporter [Neobacillus cucumis]|uniref:MFS transporter n=1 Tax=Neobacillus cucumis TaxID=1740721 RepID=UPI0028536A8A|nr:MFS transporter [Neobacillus cucumis]MDR4945965.1 MFS transporter [Neobacillus cucumis]